MSDKMQVAKIVSDSLYNAGVRIVFGIPGAKIDAIFNALLDHPHIKLIVCRHEQNAAFMAAAHGRITGTPGVCLATSGPGAANLVTGLVTATTEGDPVVAIVGDVPRTMSSKRTHQSMRAMEILSPAVKSATTVEVEDQAAEAVLSAFRTALTEPKGAAVIDLATDITAGSSAIGPFPPAAFYPPLLGPASSSDLIAVTHMLEKARLPVFLLGQRASDASSISAVHQFLERHPTPVVETFQAAGAVPKKFAKQLYFGRVGIFRTQPGDRLLSTCDLVVALGYDPVEYDANLWNPTGQINIVHVDVEPCAYNACYKPKKELIGSISENLLALAKMITKMADPAASEVGQSILHHTLSALGDHSVSQDPLGRVKPLHFISALQRHVPEDVTVTCDVGTVYIFMMRYFKAYSARRLLCSNGQQTLGVGMPWAISASLAQDPPCSRKVVSISGDGGFMFSSQELSTAVQQGCNITHFVWNDSHYNMVEFQEEAKYGRSSGIKIGGVDFAKFAEAFDAKGFRIDDGAHLEEVMTRALNHKGVAVVDVKIDYDHSGDLMKDLLRNSVG